MFVIDNYGFSNEYNCFPLCCLMKAGILLYYWFNSLLYTMRPVKSYFWILLALNLLIHVVHGCVRTRVYIIRVLYAVKNYKLKILLSVLYHVSDILFLCTKSVVNLVALDIGPSLRLENHLNISSTFENHLKIISW